MMSVWRVTPPRSGCGSTGWQKLDGNALTTSIAAGGTDLFQLHADGELWRYTGTPCSGTSCPGWQHLDHNARTEAIFTGPGLYQVHAN
jgi:hypothetical protein